MLPQAQEGNNETKSSLTCPDRHRAGRPGLRPGDNYHSPLPGGSRRGVNHSPSRGGRSGAGHPNRSLVTGGPLTLPGDRTSHRAANHALTDRRRSLALQLTRGWYKVLTASQEVELSPLGFKHFEDRFYVTYVATDNPQCFSGHFASGSVYLKVYDADFNLLQEAEVLQQVQDEMRGFHPAVEVTDDHIYIIYTTIEGNEADRVYVSEYGRTK